MSNVQCKGLFLTQNGSVKSVRVSVTFVVRMIFQYSFIDGASVNLRDHDIFTK
jgi:hypothetical protein